MKSALVLGSLFAALTCFSGCGNSPDRLVKRQIAQMNDFADALENDATESELEAIKDDMKATGERLNELDISEEQGEELRKRHQKDFNKAAERVRTAWLDKKVKELGERIPAVQRDGLPATTPPGDL